MATQDGWVMVESSDREWCTGEGNGKPLQYFCLENSMNNNEEAGPKRKKCPAVFVSGGEIKL